MCRGQPSIGPLELESAPQPAPRGDCTHRPYSAVLGQPLPHSLHTGALPQPTGRLAQVVSKEPFETKLLDLMKSVTLSQVECSPLYKGL